MARCRECKKAIKWIQVYDQGDAKWQACDKTKPLSKHQCKKKPDPPRFSRVIQDPWWNN